MQEFFDSVLLPLARGFNILKIFAPIWAPIILGFGFWKLWVVYVQAKNIAKKEFVLLEVRLPKEQPRSPLAIELFLNGLHQKGQIGTFIKRYWEGNVIPWFSLELVSLEGEIHFIIRCEKFFKSLVETQIYAQLPTAEIHEVDDYTQRIHYDEQKYSMWGGEFVLTNKDPYPIKTYVDYGLDRDPKEEYKIDPMTPMLEWLGSLQKGEQGWVQIVTRFHDKNAWKKDSWWKWKKYDTWTDEAKKEIEGIKKSATAKSDPDRPGQLALTPGQRDTIAAIERSVSKNAFDVGIRVIYIALQESFRPINMPSLISSWKSYGSLNLNGFRPNNGTSFDYPWQDPFGWRLRKKKREMFDAFRRRLFFHPPYRRKPFVLNTEELATIYHFPGEIATTPTLQRIESRKAEPPTNLPI